MVTGRSSCLQLAVLPVLLLVSAFGAPAQETEDSGLFSDPRVLWEHASIYRDEWGVPHIYADDVRSLAFAFGYAQAEDHLEPMLLAYRVANGTAAEVAGEAMAASDEFSLKMGHALLAQAAFEQADPLTRDLCEGFSLGANAWIVEHPDGVPAWADGVRPADILALMHCYLMSMAPLDMAATWRRDPASVSGNAWAVAPPRSESGKPMLVVNPHTAYDGPFQWYEAHLVCEDMNVAGGTLFGLPVILQGHNPVLGWAMTPNQPDFADVYIESPLTFEQDDESKKKVNDSLQPLEERMMQLLLLNHERPYMVNTPGGVVERSTACMTTSRGPVMGTLAGRMCSWHIGGYYDFGALVQLVEMARADCLEAFRAAIGMQQLPCFHIVYGDQGGNIAYLYNAKTGIRTEFIKKEGTPVAEEAGGAEAPFVVIDWGSPLPSEASVYQWGGIFPADVLPSVVNPEAGYVQACGNPPWAAVEKAGIAPENLPPWLVLDRDTARAQRVRSLLSMGKRSFRDCQAMLYDVVVPFAVDAVPKLLRLAEQRPDYVANAHPDLHIGLDVLKSWNYLADTNSTGMTFFQAWWTALRAQAPEGAPWYRDAVLYDAFRSDPAMEDAALDAATEAARMMRNEFQTLTVPWGDAHTVRRGKREVAVPGAAAGEPIVTASDYVYESRKWPVTYGYGFAMVVAFGDQPEAVSVVPFGASENADSPHFDDQLDLFAQRRFKIARFQFEDIQRNTASARGKILHLRPRGAEALFTLRATAPIEARVTASPETKGTLPEGLVPFTLYMQVEKVPRVITTETRVEVYIPPVLCAGADLSHLGLYACGSDLLWAPLEGQELNEEARTITATDQAGPRYYAVLGPEQYRATRMEGDVNPAPAFAPLTPAVSQKPVLFGPPAETTRAMPLAPELPSGKKFSFKSMRGVPPAHRVDPIKIPEPPEGEDAKPARRAPALDYFSDEDFHNGAPLSKERQREREEIEKRNRKILEKAGMLEPEPSKKALKKQKKAKETPKEKPAAQPKRSPLKVDRTVTPKSNFSGRK